MLSQRKIQSLSEPIELDKPKTDSSSGFLAEMTTEPGRRVHDLGSPHRLETYHGVRQLAAVGNENVATEVDNFTFTIRTWARSRDSIDSPNAIDLVMDTATL